MWDTRETKIGKVNLPNRLSFAPMAGISNMAVRRRAKEHGAGLVYTEMVCVQGVVRNNRKTMKLMESMPDEHPIAIQLFGHEPDVIAEAARIAQDEADIIDINFGCPARTVVRNGSGSALLKQPDLIGEIISKTVESVTCPVTAKMRSGWDNDSVKAIEIAKMMENSGASSVTIHPRTKSQGFSGTSDWNIIADVKSALSIPVIGNGDVKTPEDAKRMLEMTNCDGIMIGRGALGNPWIFSQTLKYLETGLMDPEPVPYERLEGLLELARDFVALKGEYTACREIRKFIKWYTKGMQNITDFRCKAMLVETLSELEDLVYQEMDIAS